MEHKKYTPSSVLLRNTLINLLGMILPVLVGIIAIPFALKGLSNEGFGILSIVWVIVGYFSILDFGISRGTTKLVAECLGEKRQADLNSIFWTASFLNLIFGIAGTIIFFLITPYLVENVLNVSPNFIQQTKLSFYLSALSFPVILFSANARGVLSAAQRFDLVNRVLIPVSVSSFIFPALSYPFELSLFTVIFLIVISRVIAAFYYIHYCWRIFPPIREQISFSQKFLKKLISYGGWVTITNIISPLLVYMDRFFIGSILSVSVVAFYTAPYDIANRLRVLPIAIMNTVFPEFSALSHNSENTRVEKLFSRSIKYILLLVGPFTLLLAFYAPEILRVWLGQDFAYKSTVVLRIIATGIVINSLAAVPFNLLQGIGKPDLPAKFHIAEFPFYIVLLWLLTKNYGILGAAIAWFLRVTLDFILLYSWSSRFYPTLVHTLGEFRIWREFFLLFDLVMFVLLVRVLVKNPLTEIPLLFIILLVFFMLVWYYIFDNTEKKTISDFVRNLIR